MELVRIRKNFLQFLGFPVCTRFMKGKGTYWWVLLHVLKYKLLVWVDTENRIDIDNRILTDTVSRQEFLEWKERTSSKDFYMSYSSLFSSSMFILKGWERDELSFSSSWKLKYCRVGKASFPLNAASIFSLLPSLIAYSFVSFPTYRCHFYIIFSWKCIFCQKVNRANPERFSPHS